MLTLLATPTLPLILICCDVFFENLEQYINAHNILIKIYEKQLKNIKLHNITNINYNGANMKLLNLTVNTSFNI